MMALYLKFWRMPACIMLLAVVISGVEPAAAAGAMDEVTIISTLARHKFKVELAATEEARRTGLMNRQELAKDAGMLFVFPVSGRHGFWMKNTLIPLDMLFIGEDGRIVDLFSNAQPLSLTPIVPSENAVAVLEINGGLARRLGIAIGDQVLHPSLSGR